MQAEINSAISNKSFNSIFLTGFLDKEYDGTDQYYPDMRFLLFEFDDNMVEFTQYEPINQSLQLRIKIIDFVRYELDFEEMVPCKTRIKEIVLKTPQADKRVIKMNHFNSEENDCELLCDSLLIKLSNGQVIIMNPGFIGINFGSLDVKKVWEENLVNGVLPEEICIEFQYK